VLGFLAGWLRRGGWLLAGWWGGVASGKARSSGGGVLASLSGCLWVSPRRSSFAFGLPCLLFFLLICVSSCYNRFVGLGFLPCFLRSSLSSLPSAFPVLALAFRPAVLSPPPSFLLAPAS
jgi:hypothetical protein